MDKIDKNLLDKPFFLEDQQQFVELENETNSVCFYINGLLSEKVISNIVDELNRKPDSLKILLLILKSDGGYAYCCNKTIKKYIRGNTHIEKLHVIINEYVKSAASVLALSSDKLYFIDEYTGMGCIDPKLPEWDYLSIFDKYGNDLKLFESKDENSLESIDQTDYKLAKETIRLTREAIMDGKIFNHKKFEDQFRFFMGLTDEFDYSTYHKKPIPTKIIKNIGINAKIIDKKSSLYKKAIHVIKDAMTIQKSINKQLAFFILGKNFVFF